MRTAIEFEPNTEKILDKLEGSLWIPGSSGIEALSKELATEYL